MILFKVSLAIFMAGSLLDMGLRLNLPNAIRGFRDVRFVAYTLIWSFVVCPALTAQWAVLANVGWQNWDEFGKVEVGVDSATPQSFTKELN